MLLIVSASICIYFTVSTHMYVNIKFSCKEHNCNCFLDFGSMKVIDILIFELCLYQTMQIWQRCSLQSIPFSFPIYLNFIEVVGAYKMTTLMKLLMSWAYM